MGLVGERVRLVPLDRARHFENCLRWLNDPEVTENLLLDFPMSRASEERFFDDLERGAGADWVFAIELLDGTHIGNSGLHDINHRHGVATSGSFIGDREQRGKGYGTEAAILRSHYAFHILGLRQLLSSYLGDNPASSAMQLKVGYEVVGIFPERYWKAGRFVDETRTFLRKARF